MTGGDDTGFEATIRHPGRVAIGAGVALALAALVALQDPVAGWERSLVEAANGLPDPVFTGLWAPMQLGTLLGPGLLALAALLWRRDDVAVAAVGAGLAAWFGAKLAKELVERERPLAFVARLDIRDGDGTGLGFPSGHAAVAAATAVVALALLPRRARPVVVVLAVLVGLARLVAGVHFPVDVVGGWALGTLVGVAAVALVDRRRRPESVDVTEDR